MGLLDSLAGAVLGKVLGGGQQQALVEGVLGMLGKGGGQGGKPVDSPGSLTCSVKKAWAIKSVHG